MNSSPSSLEGGATSVVESSDFMRDAYIDYAMSVILARALPDVRDGLKPVQRRILYAMKQMGMEPTKQHRKCAGIVGEVIKNFHPHGDSSIYGALVLMGQWWSLLHPYVDPHGNFGNIDGDAPAAHRYTEARMSPLGSFMFEGIEKDLVDFVPTYDGEHEEPTVLPSFFPAVLVNGSSGIAVGVATYIPPHNLEETVAAYLAYVDNPDVTTREIMALMPAPDFPNGGVVHGLDGYASAVETGRGRVMLRSTWREVEKGQAGGPSIVIEQTPFGISRSAVVERIGEVWKAEDPARVIAEIAKVRDQKDGIYVDLKRGADAEVVFNQLLAHVEGLERSVNYNVNVLFPGATAAEYRPQVMGFKEVFSHCLRFGIGMVRREARRDLAKALDRLHVLAGLMVAAGRLDEAISAIRGSADRTEAAAKLASLLGLDDVQVKEILDLRLHRLTSLELEGLENEHDRVLASIDDLRDFLASDGRQIEEVKKRASDATRFAVSRKTEIANGLSSLAREDLVEREDVAVVLTRGNYLKRIPVTALNRQNRGTRGKSWMSTGDEDQVAAIYTGSSHDYLLAFTSRGHVLAKKAFMVDEGGPGTKGRHVRNVFDGLVDDVVGVLMAPDFSEDLFLVTVSAKGSIKRTPLSDYTGSVKKGGVIAVGIDDGDEIVAVDVLREHDHVIVVGSGGRATRFIANVEQMRPQGRAAGGTRAITLAGDERVVGMMIVRGNGKPQGARSVTREAEGGGQETVEALDTSAMDAGRFLLCMGRRGIGKRTEVAEFPVKGRGGKGVICFNVLPKTGPLVRALEVREGQDLLVVTEAGVSNRIRVEDVKKTGRSASGSIIVALDKKNDDKVADVATAVRPEDEATANAAQKETP